MVGGRGAGMGTGRAKLLMLNRVAAKDKRPKQEAGSSTG